MADDMGGSDIMIPKAKAKAPAPAPEPITAPPPPFVELQSKSVGAGIGLSWGQGTLLFEGEQHPFSVKGLGLGDVGIASLVGSGHVKNLNSVADFAGNYVAVGAGAAAGVGASVVSMRNQNGVVINLNAELKGLALNLGPEGFHVNLQ